MKDMSTIQLPSSTFKKEITPYQYIGTENKTILPKFVKLCKMTQKRLKSWLATELGKYFDKDNIVNEDGFLYVKGSLPVLLTAHMDTVHSEPVKTFYEYTDDHGNHILHSPQGIGGDDRCGIYIILKVLESCKSQGKEYPTILFCEDEEVGGVGSRKFCSTQYIKELNKIKYMIEIDRAYKDDAVFYSCDNADFTKYICNTTGFQKSYGSFSDISILAPQVGVAAVNLSCGYYDAHTLKEKVYIEEMINTITVIEKLLDDVSNVEQFEYIEEIYDDDWSYYNNWYNKYNNKYYQSANTTQQATLFCYEIQWVDKLFQENYQQYEAHSLQEALGMFFLEHEDVCFNDVTDYCRY